MHVLGEAAASLLAGWAPALGQLLLVLVVGVLAYVPGRRVVELLWSSGPAAASAAGGRGPRAGVEDVAISATLGLVLFASGGFLLGLAGALGAGSFAALVLAAQVAAHRVWRRIALSLPTRLRPAGLFRPTASPPSAWDIGASLLVAALLAVPLLALALISLYPPHLFDSTAYHLPYTQGFLATGGLPVLPDLVYPVFPQMAEMLWVPLFPAFGAPGAHAVVLLHGLLAAAAAYAWGCRLEGRPAGAFAAALWLGCPGVVLYATVAYVDVVLAHFVAAAGLTAWVGWQEPEGSGRRWDRRWLAAAGVFAGAGAAVKYHGLVLALLGAAAVLAWGGRGGGRRWRALALYLLLAGAVAAPWYLHVHLATGSPLHPFLTGRAGSEAGPAPATSSLPARSQPWSLPPALARGVDKAVSTAVRDWDKVPRILREETLSGARDYGPPHLVAWLLALIPLAALPSLRLRGGAAVLAVVAVYAVGWFVTARDPRYLLYPAILLCPIAGAVAARLLSAAGRRRAPGFAVCVVVGVLLAAPGTLYAGFRLASLGPLPRTAASADLFLAQRVPGYLALTAVQEAAGPVTVYAVNGNRLHAFASGRLMAPAGWRLPVAGEGGGLGEALRGQGVEFVLVVHGVEGRSGPGETGAEAIARRLAAAPGITRRSRIAATDVFAVEGAARPE